jgi:hypothetical protein
LEVRAGSALKNAILVSNRQMTKGRLPDSDTRSHRIGVTLSALISSDLELISADIHAAPSA